MLSISDQDPFELSLNIKKTFPDKPVVILAPDSREIALRLNSEDLSSIDYVLTLARQH
ncbi:MAG: hypothetical protein U5L72_02145 [Bacteroidales bacterium]|nr:hypothetical protein [Bacteroidales bacterium]